MTLLYCHFRIKNCKALTSMYGGTAIDSAWLVRISQNRLLHLARCVRCLLRKSLLSWFSHITWFCNARKNVIRGWHLLRFNITSKFEHYFCLSFRLICLSHGCSVVIILSKPSCVSMPEDHSWGRMPLQVDHQILVEYWEEFDFLVLTSSLLWCKLASTVEHEAMIYT